MPRPQPRLVDVPAECGVAAPSAVGPEYGDGFLARARAHAERERLAYAGCVTPREAWALMQSGGAMLVDVRSAEELKFVGRVAQAFHVPWAQGIDLVRNPGFLDELERTVDRACVVLFLCRSGIRSANAAEAATRAGFAHAFNVAEGFEGDRDASGRRGTRGGWRFHGLPWIQD
jgi:rhodanese-related sulfurtransferase